jgi:hypothetical protein
MADIGARLYAVTKETLEPIMRLSYLLLASAVWLGACAQHLVISSQTVTRWQDRDIQELITVIGPVDTSTIQGGSRSYFWNRFGNCQVTAHTTLDDKIVKIDLQGTTLGCSTYLDKIGDGPTSPPKPQ